MSVGDIKSAKQIGESALDSHVHNPRNPIIAPSFETNDWTPESGEDYEGENARKVTLMKINKGHVVRDIEQV